MKSYRKELWFNAPDRMHFTNITSEIRTCLEESNIEEGNQKITPDLNDLKYGVSLTDACINWQSTEKLLLRLAEKLRKR